MYGICCDCGEDIPAKRLEAVPGAIRCRSCQEEVEKK
ncbi:TraR/DksA C4-type zinc finger protein [Patescibacteria group bacterium]|nr:TraR/DksA C4-type zinc finger protein [Patescibacteria group bacterium]